MPRALELLHQAIDTATIDGLRPVCSSRGWGKIEKTTAAEFTRISVGSPSSEAFARTVEAWRGTITQTEYRGTGVRVSYSPELFCSV